MLIKYPRKNNNQSTGQGGNIRPGSSHKRQDWAELLAMNTKDRRLASMAYASAEKGLRHQESWTSRTEMILQNKLQLLRCWASESTDSSGEQTPGCLSLRVTQIQGAHTHSPASQQRPSTPSWGPALFLIKNYPLSQCPQTRTGVSRGWGQLGREEALLSWASWYRHGVRKENIYTTQGQKHRSSHSRERGRKGGTTLS